jgi:hypothetical protein
MESFARQMRQHRGLVLLLLSGFVVPLLTNLLSSWLEKTLGQNPAQMLQLLAVGFAVAVALWVLYLALRQERRQWVLVPREQQPPRYPGLIVLVGPGRPDEDPLKGPTGPAIEYHLVSDEQGQTLQVCWLLASSQGVPVAEAFRQRYESRCRVLVRQIHKPFDVQETYQAVQRVYLEEALAEGLSPEQIIADFTGGTRPMSAGMVLACGDRWPMQYMTGRKEGVVSTPVFIQFSPVEQGG